MAKMAQTVADDGAVTFAFENAGEQTYRLEDFPQNVQNFFALFGLRTKLRNFTAAEKTEGVDITPQQMFDKMLKGVKLLQAGVLRAAREPGEKRGGGTLILEAAVIYKQMKLAKAGDTTPVDPIQVAQEFEALTDEQIEELKGTKLFAAALAQAKLARAQAKAEKAAKEVEEEAAAK